MVGGDIVKDDIERTKGQKTQGSKGIPYNVGLTSSKSGKECVVAGTKLSFFVQVSYIVVYMLPLIALMKETDTF